MSEATRPANVDGGATGTRMRKALALVSLAVGLAAAVAGIVGVRAAVRRMPALSPTDSMIVAGGRPGTPGAAAPSPVRPPLRRTPPPTTTSPVIACATTSGGR